ncbi:hypothetical protein BJ878DRAFT_491481 [Calycina marina]|uniref:DUF7721 domain-containing protein n=1 Tax=Calycina marina TaxID=1763456 RepID=A0A9P7Z965_9HELO|nr:hypothetical protein BJ878DRAFT_491481 [Calycina marina]
MSGYGRNEGGYGGGNDGSYDTQGRESGGQNQSYYGGGDENQGGRQEYNEDRQYGGRQQHQGGYGGANNGSYGGGGGYGNEEDLSGAQSQAEQHSGSSGDSSIFSSVLGALQGNKHSIAQQPINEEHAVQSHQQFFGGGGSSQQASSGSMGSAAAMQALKMFTGGSSGSSQSENGQNAFVGMAMAQASKLFEQQSSQGNVASGSSKESAVQQAGEMALKMYMKSSGGGSSGLLGLVSKFL